jgi:S-adenosyl-L-methionine hydrolase (adenosine-forming)
LQAKIVTFTSDFGLKDPYVAEMKAAVLGICPSAVLVDVTHGVEKFNVRAGAFMLASAAPYFPHGTVHVAVVDPSVGSQRRPIIIETANAFFVGPDNGLLLLAAEAQGITRFFEITSRRLALSHVSNTFHGRDIFAPAAAHLLNGTNLEEFGPQITDVVKPQFSTVIRSHEALIGEVLHVDDFGNIVTNINWKELANFRESIVQVEFSNHVALMKVSNSYASVKLHDPLLVVGSHNFAEVALNQGNAAAKFQVKTGDKITLTRV